MGGTWIKMLGEGTAGRYCLSRELGPARKETQRQVCNCVFTVLCKTFILASQGCCNKVLQTGWLKIVKFILSQFQGLEVKAKDWQDWFLLETLRKKSLLLS